MYNKILLLDTNSALSSFIIESLKAEGYEVTLVESPRKLSSNIHRLEPNLILANTIAKRSYHLSQLKAVAGDIPVVALVDQESSFRTQKTDYKLTTPFGFQDLLLMVQDILYQRTVVGEKPLQFTDTFISSLTDILSPLRQELRARCIVLSSSSGRLITTVGSAEQGISMSLAALMSAGFSATARAAQMLGYGDMFDSSLQESEGYGLYAIRLYDKLILSVAFSDQITIGMVRHRTAQAAVDILEMIADEAKNGDAPEDFQLDANFRETVNETLGELFKE